MRLFTTRSYIPRRTLVIHALVFLTGVFVSFIVFGWQKQRDIAYGVRENSPSYKFISPLLFVKTPEEQAFPQYAPLESAIEDYVAKEKTSHEVTEMSVYFRNLQSSQWVAVNAESEFSPASLQKVITLLTVLRSSETNANLLSSRVNVEEVDEKMNEMYFPPLNPVRSGERRTVEELLEQAIVESDNIANFILLEIVGGRNFAKTHTDLELRFSDESTDNIYTALEYSRIFRTLYNGTYLSRANSEKALELLSRTTFTQGLVAGVPEGTVVSHKFGTRALLSEGSSVEDPDTVKELHDCGIIYYPDHPYFLCIMTRGTDFKKLESVIRDASALVWKEIEKLH